MGEHRRLPLAPLIARLDTADHLGVPRRTWQRWIASGTMPWHRADELAVAAGSHPGIVWGEAWWRLPPPRRDLWSQHRPTRLSTVSTGSSTATSNAQGRGASVTAMQNDAPTEARAPTRFSQRVHDEGGAAVA